MKHRNRSLPNSLNHIQTPKHRRVLAEQTVVTANRSSICSSPTLLDRSIDRSDSPRLHGLRTHPQALRASGIQFLLSLGVCLSLRAQGPIAEIPDPKLLLWTLIASVLLQFSSLCAFPFCSMVAHCSYLQSLKLERMG